MFAYYVDLSQFNTVKDFVRIAEGKACTVALESNCGKWKVNGKNIMGIFSLDLSKPVKLTVEANDFSKDAIKMILLTGGNVVKVQ